jgi:hypothetical protein
MNLQPDSGRESLDERKDSRRHVSWRATHGAEGCASKLTDSVHFLAHPAPAPVGEGCARKPAHIAGFMDHPDAAV